MSAQLEGVANAINMVSNAFKNGSITSAQYTKAIGKISESLKTVEAN